MPRKADMNGRDRDCLLEPLESHYTHLADARVLVDLRKHPRFDTRLPAELSPGGGPKTRATITNLSRSGLRLEGNRQMLDTLFPNYQRQPAHMETWLTAEFAVPAGSGQHRPVTVQCRTVYIRQENSDTWQVGMAFSAIINGEKAFNDYLRQLEYSA